MSFFELLHLMRKRLVVVIALPVAVAALLIVYKLVGSSPVYTAKTSVFVNRSQIYESVEGESVVALAQATTNDISGLFKSDGAIEAALDASGLSKGEFGAYSINPSNGLDTNIITLEVSGPDGQKAAIIANAITEYVASTANVIMNVDSVTILVSADVNSPAVSGNASFKDVFKYAIFGAMVGLFIAIVLIGIQDMFDNRVRSADEAAALLGMPVIGRFPKRGR